jgi:hypothetical protein
MGLYERLLEEKHFMELEEKLYPPRLYDKCGVCGMPVRRDRTPLGLTSGGISAYGFRLTCCDECAESNDS